MLSLLLELNNNLKLLLVKVLNSEIKFLGIRLSVKKVLPTSKYLVKLNIS